MKIFSRLPEDKITDDAVPIEVYIGNRADLVVLLLRILRYLFQEGLCGPDYKWTNDEDTGITIEDSFLENPNEFDTKPAITISCGGISFTKESIDRNKTSYNLDDYDMYTRHFLPVNLDIRGRNKLETYRLSETLAAALFLLTETIVEYCPNIEDITQVSASPIVPLSDLEQAGDDGKQFRATVSFVIEYFVMFRMFKLGDLFTATVFQGDVAAKSDSDDTEFTYITSIQTEENSQE